MDQPVLESKGKKRRLRFLGKSSLRRMILDGWSQAMIGERARCSRENVRVRLHRAGLYDLYVRCSEENLAPHSKTLLTRLLSAAIPGSIDPITLSTIGHTLLYDLSSENRTSIMHRRALPKIESVMHEYFRCVYQGKPFLMYETCTKSNLSTSQFSHVLEKLELDFDREACAKVTRPVATLLKEIGKENVCAAINKYGFSVADVAYFHCVQAPALDEYLVGLTSRDKEAKKALQVFGKMTYRTLSDIYEAADLGFSLDHPSDGNQIATLVGKKDTVVREALQRRPDFEKTIIGGLRCLFPYKEVAKPYRSWK
ncbi:hypothetical protein HZA98_03105, partial [Candidatus Woesearchaeota archaeon]|nr:hypothetical protein [Candidatus Woesearchaeota archaeon]